ncbi:MAG TPA: GspH/FimT family protein [Verrucomicrobiae bacterium]|nr:GspH/FimT family protein [Verrucomicrobiae bacterium]
MARVAATPLVGAAVTRGRPRSVVPRDAGDGRWTHVHAIREPAADSNPDTLIVRVPISLAVFPGFFIAVRVSFRFDGLGHRFASRRLTVCHP